MKLFLRSLKKITLIHIISRFKIQGSLLLVCKNIFIKVLGISADRVRRICSLLIQNKIPEDCRGKNRSGNAIPGEICRKVHDHVEMFEEKQTHYGGKQKQYVMWDIKPQYHLFFRIKIIISL